MASNKLRAGLLVQARNVRVMLLRDMMMRYGRSNIGFVWVILESMILTAGVMVVWSLMGASKHGLRIVELVLTGYMPLTLWRHLTGGVINIFRNSSPLLYHRQITLFDIIYARKALEIIGTTAALLCVWGVLNTLGVVSDIQRLDLFVLGWIMMALIGTSFGMILAAVTEISETSERFIQPIQYLLIPISGAFFMVDWLPPWGQKLIMYNPLVHSYEVFRAGYFGEAVPTHYELDYFFACVFVLFVIGIWSVDRVRPYVKLS